MDIRNVFGWTRVHPNDLKTIASCKTLVSNLFQTIAELYGEDRARNIFADYGKPLTKRQIKLDIDAALLLKCDEMKPLNVRKLAMHLAKESGKDKIVLAPGLHQTHDLDGAIRQRHPMLAIALHAIGGNGPDLRC